jgi:hypothetical protein
LPVAGLATHRSQLQRLRRSGAVHDNSDKGDLRFDWQITPSSSGSCASATARRRRQLSHHSHSARRPDQRQHPHPRPADRARLHPAVRRQQGARRAPRPGSHQGRQVQPLHRQYAFNNIPGLPNGNAVVAGGLPSIGISGFTGFGRQSTNPQWQDPALLDPKVNFTWVKGNHSLKFGYEYEHIWMAVNDNNPLYGSFTYGGGYSNAGGSTVADTYWADFLFGTTSAYSLANFYEAHLTQNTTTSMRRTTGR